MLDPKQNPEMEAAQKAFLALNADNRIIFIGWARTESNKDIFKQREEAINDVIADVSNTATNVLGELGKGAQSFSEKMKAFINKP